MTFTTRIRKEISLPEDIVGILEAKAIRDKRKLKPYMEKVLIEHAKPVKSKVVSKKK